MRLYALTLHDGADGLDMNIHKLPGLGTWRVIDAPPGCASGWYVCVVTPNSEHGLWKIHRFPDWSVMLLTTGAVKCSWEFPRRHKDPWTHELGVDDEQDVCPCADGKWQVNLSSLMSRIEEKPLLLRRNCGPVAQAPSGSRFDRSRSTVKSGGESGIRVAGRNHR